MKFVAVRDEEAPRSEQDEGAQAKHRKWDSMVIGRESGSGDAGGKGKGKKPHIDRGWGTGQVGWGVQGKFGSNEQDDGSNVMCSICVLYVRKHHAFLLSRSQ